MKHRRSNVVAFVFNNSLLLLIGTAAAVLWANLDLATYEAFADPLHFSRRFKRTYGVSPRGYRQHGEPAPSSTEPRLPALTLRLSRPD